MNNKLAIISMSVLLFATASTASAANLVKNGSFELSSSSGPVGISFRIGNTTIINNWTVASVNGPDYYAGYFNNSNATTVGAPVAGNPNPPSFYYLPTSYTGGDPDGGYFVGLDGQNTDGSATEIFQTINGLKAGQTYNLTFDWAGTQLNGTTGPTTEYLAVSLGNETHNTALVSGATHYFTGWLPTSMSFTATGTSEVLNFLSVGTPGGSPPTALLDGVSLTAAVPESSTWAMMMIGFVAVGASVRRRRTMLSHA